MERRSDQNLGIGKKHLLKGQKRGEENQTKNHKAGNRTKPWQKSSQKKGSGKGKKKGKVHKNKGNFQEERKGNIMPDVL